MKQVRNSKKTAGRPAGTNNRPRSARFAAQGGRRNLPVYSAVPRKKRGVGEEQPGSRGRVGARRQPVRSSRTPPRRGTGGLDRVPRWSSLFQGISCIPTRARARTGHRSDRWRGMASSRRTPGRGRRFRNRFARHECGDTAHVHARLEERPQGQVDADGGGALLDERKAAQRGRHQRLGFVPPDGAVCGVPRVAFPCKTPFSSNHKGSMHRNLFQPLFSSRC